MLLLIALFIWCGNLEYRKLSLSDEGRYSEIPREMAQSGDWVTPRLNGIKYFEKPALQYWATAAAYKVFGEYNWTARIWPALTGLLGVLFTFIVGARLYGRTAGLYAAAVLASSVLYAGMAHILTLDMGLACFLTVAFAGLMLGLDPRADDARNRRWLHVAAAGCAFAVLSKGLIGIVLPGAVVTLYILIKRDFRLLRKLHLVSCGVLFLAITAPWFIAVSWKNPEFAWFFFVHEHFQRYTSTIHQRYQPWYFFIPILVAGILPWLFTMFDALSHSFRRLNKDKAFDPLFFSLLWAGFIFAFFSASGSKLPSYILPIFPALALIIGTHLATIRGPLLAWQLTPIALLGVAGLIAVPFTVQLASDKIPVDLYIAQTYCLYAAALTLLLGMLVAIYSGWRGHVRNAVIACALSGLTTTQLLVTSEDALSPAHSTYHIAQEIKPYLNPATPFYSVRTYEQTLPFYIKRTVTLVDYRDEMDFGLQQEPSLWVPTLAEFTDRWRKDDDALAVMSLEVFAELQQAGLPMQVVARDTERIIVRTPPHP
ncbi:MAG: glycosyl transferase family 39 [Betaproteobacteria bacterium]|nr:glycosyl transferase family 39 [Betaproteobacteria bacterium]